MRGKDDGGEIYLGNLSYDARERWLVDIHCVVVVVVTLYSVNSCTSNDSQECQCKKDIQSRSNVEYIAVCCPHGIPLR